MVSATNHSPLIIYASSAVATKTGHPLPLTFLLSSQVFHLLHCLFPKNNAYRAELQHLSEDSSESTTTRGLADSENTSEKENFFFLLMQ